VAVQHVSSVGAAGLGGAVGMEGEGPAVTVDADVVVVLAQQDAVGERGFSAVGLVAQVVDVALGGGAVASRPGAVVVADLDGAPDVAGDGAAAADVEGKAWGVPGLVQQALAEGGGDARGPGHQVDGEAGDGVAQGAAGF
jgi:hypothetical protein